MHENSKEEKSKNCTPKLVPSTAVAAAAENSAELLLLN